MAIVGRKKTRSPFLGDRTEPGRFVAERAAEINFSQLSCLHRDSIFHRPPTFIGIDGKGADRCRGLELAGQMRPMWAPIGLVIRCLGRFLT